MGVCAPFASHLTPGRQTGGHRPRGSDPRGEPAKSTYLQSSGRTPRPQWRPCRVEAGQRAGPGRAGALPSQVPNRRSSEHPPSHERPSGFTCLLGRPHTHLPRGWGRVPRLVPLQRPQHFPQEGKGSQRIFTGDKLQRACPGPLHPLDTPDLHGHRVTVRGARLTASPGALGKRRRGGRPCAASGTTRIATTDCSMLD